MSSEMSPGKARPQPEDKTERSDGANPPNHSTMTLIGWLKDGESDKQNAAARELLFHHWGHELCLAARHRLSDRLRQRIDEDDILQCMYASFCLRLRKGDFDGISGREDLWKLLVAITVRKVYSAARKHGAACRDYRREVRGNSQTESDDSSHSDWLQNQIQSGPTPAEAVALNEEFEQLLKLLSPDLRQIAVRKLGGYTNDEIAERLGFSPRLIEMQVARIRRQWIVPHLVELFEDAWRDGQHVAIEALLASAEEEYCAGATEAEREALKGKLLRRLLEVECKFRLRQGEKPALEEYRRRFPTHARLIEFFFNQHDEASHA